MGAGHCLIKYNYILPKGIGTNSTLSESLELWFWNQTLLQFHVQGFAEKKLTMAGLRKSKKYDWKDTNLALFGSDTEKNVSSLYEMHRKIRIRQCLFCVSCGNERQHAVAGTRADLESHLFTLIGFKKKFYSKLYRVCNIFNASTRTKQGH